MASSDSSIAPTRNARLACACNCAYGIGTKSGDYVPPKIYDPGVGWLESPVAVSAPESGDPHGPRINACLIGRNHDGIVVAFRGTLPPAWTVASLEDWWQDIVDSEPVDAAPLPGKVHEGFWQALETIWQDTVEAVRALYSRHPGTPVYVTGHSKGGPLASIGAARLLLTQAVGVSEVVTFASPHPGNGEFVSGYPSTIALTRFENYLDIVPFLPPTDTFYKFVHDIIPADWRRDFCNWFPSLCKALEHAAQWDYQSLGPLQFVTEDGKVVGSDDFQADSLYRLLQIIATMLDFDSRDDLLEAIRQDAAIAVSESGLARIGAAHCMGCRSDQPSSLCAGGYMTGAGGDPICPGR